MSFIRRNIRSCPPSAKANAYKTYVRPVMEYASSVWSPHTANHIEQLEMVQRRAARFVKNDYAWTSSVTSMLTDLKWNTLLQRREATRLTMLYKIKHEHIDLTPDPHFIAARSARGHDQRIRQIRARTTTYQQSFYPATIILWNALPQVVVDRTSVESFHSAVLATYIN